MTFRLSTGARNGQLAGLGLQGMFNRGYIEIYSGSQPTTADSLKTGTLLGVVTSGSLALTKETRATGTITLATGAAGSVNTVTVGGLNIIPDGAVAFNTSLTITATDLATAINRNGLFEATSSGAVVTIKPRPGAGDAFNAAVVTSTLTTITATYADISGGVDSANGLILASPDAGSIAKPLPAVQVWSFAGVAAGTAGWFRFYGSDTADSGALLSAAPWYPRLDGSIATSGGDMALSNILVAVGAPNTVDRFIVTAPAS